MQPRLYLCFPFVMLSTRFRLYKQTFNNRLFSREFEETHRIVRELRLAPRRGRAGASPRHDGGLLHPAGVRRVPAGDIWVMHNWQDIASGVGAQPEIGGQRWPS